MKFKIDSKIYLEQYYDTKLYSRLLRIFVESIANQPTVRKIILVVVHNHSSSLRLQLLQGVAYLVSLRRWNVLDFFGAFLVGHGVRRRCRMFRWRLLLDLVNCLPVFERALLLGLGRIHGLIIVCRYLSRTQNDCLVIASISLIVNNLFLLIFDYNLLLLLRTAVFFYLFQLHCRIVFVAKFAFCWRAVDFGWLLPLPRSDLGIAWLRLEELPVRVELAYLWKSVVLLLLLLLVDQVDVIHTSIVVWIFVKLLINLFLLCWLCRNILAEVLLLFVNALTKVRRNFIVHLQTLRFFFLVWFFDGLTLQLQVLGNLIGFYWLLKNHTGARHVWAATRDIVGLALLSAQSIRRRSLNDDISRLMLHLVEW